MNAMVKCLMMSFVIAFYSCEQGHGIDDTESNVKDWETILGPSKGEIPSNADDHEPIRWLDDLAAAQVLAKETNKPLLIVFRCLPCKQCSRFDEDVLLATGELKKSLHQFITVRLTSMHDIDLRIFPIEQYQDLDLSWWGWFMSPDYELYSVFGGKDQVSDTTRISVEALNNAARRVLAHHYDPRRKDWALDGEAPDLSGDITTPLDYPGLEGWLKNNEYARTQIFDENCLHCHQVPGIIIQPEIDAGTFDKHTDFDIWPYPENLGITLNRDHGLRVDFIGENSSAKAAGLIEGDIIAAIGGRKVFNQTDLRAVLHKSSPDTFSIPVWWFRKGELMHATIKPGRGWKASDLSWRKSVAESGIGAHHGFPWPVRVSKSRRTKFGIKANTMAIEPYFGKNSSGPAYQAGLRYDHIITSVNGKSPDLFGRAFLVWFRLSHEKGDSVILKVLNKNGQQEVIKYRATR